jgi:hypothetical protein
MIIELIVLGSFSYLMYRICTPGTQDEPDKQIVPPPYVEHQPDGQEEAIAFVPDPPPYSHA